MITKIIIISSLLFISSCSSYNEQLSRSAKARAASSRINDTQNNSADIFKEIDN